MINEDFFADQFLDELTAYNLNAVSLAFVGDAVYSLFIRTHFCIKTQAKSGELHKKSTKYVKATAQSASLDIIEPILTEKEKDILRRGRNTKTNTVSKNASLGDYKKSTAFEAVLGYLYLSGQKERLNEILNLATKDIRSEKWLLAGKIVCMKQ